MKSDFGTKLRYYRLKANKTQKELADHLGYKTSSSIAKIEDGSNDVLASTAEKIAKFLGIEVIDFFEPIPEEKLIPHSPFMEYIPYLEKADEKTIDIVRLALGMEPLAREKKSGLGDSTKTANS